MKGTIFYEVLPAYGLAVDPKQDGHPGLVFSAPSIQHSELPEILIVRLGTQVHMPDIFSIKGVGGGSSL